MKLGSSAWSIVTSRRSLRVPRANAAAREAVQVVFDAIPEPGAREEVVRGLFGVAALLSREPRLRSALTDPGLPGEAKRSLLDSLIGDRVAPGTVSAVVAVVENQRLRGREVVEVLEDV